MKYPTYSAWHKVTERMRSRKQQRTTPSASSVRSGAEDFPGRPRRFGVVAACLKLETNESRAGGLLVASSSQGFISARAMAASMAFDGVFRFPCRVASCSDLGMLRAGHLTLGSQHQASERLWSWSDTSPLSSWQHASSIRKASSACDTHLRLKACQ